MLSTSVTLRERHGLPDVCEFADSCSSKLMAADTQPVHLYLSLHEAGASLEF